MNTLELRGYEYILWRNQTPQGVRDREYPGLQMNPVSYARRSLNGSAAYCQAWGLAEAGVVLVEVL